MSAAGAGDPVGPGLAADIVADLARRFAERHGRAPDVVWRAPGRVNLIGEHTDYNDGLCLPIALPHSTYAAAARRTDGGVTAASLQVEGGFDGAIDDLRPDGIDGWAAYAVGVVWSARAAGIDVPGLDLLVTSTVPVGAGLSSSAALEAAVATASCELAGVTVDDDLRRRLVDVCRRAETDVAGAPTGGMDQTVSLFGRADHALLIDVEADTVTPVPWRPEHDGLELLVVDTRVSHSLSDGGYGSRRDECDAAAAALEVGSLRRATLDAVEALDDGLLRRRARHVVTEIARVGEVCEALSAGAWERVGALFDASHASMRDDFEISCAELDAVCEVALAGGALGARMTGGGFGGSAIALVPAEHDAAVRRAIATHFADRGWASPTFLVPTAAESAAPVPV